MSQNEEFCLVECGVSTPTGFKRNIILNENQIKTFVEKYKNIGIYTTAYKYDTPDQNTSLLYGDLYFDFDVSGLIDNENKEETYQKVRNDCIYIVALLTSFYKIDPKFLKLYFSGKKGLHLTVPAKALGIEPRKDLNLIFKHIVEDASKYCKNKTLDTQIYDRRRLFRIPGSQHQETKLYKTPMTIDELYQLSFAEIKKLSENQRTIESIEPKLNPKSKNAYDTMIKKYEDYKPKFDDTEKRNKILDYTPPCIQFLLYNPTKNGQRNNTLAVLISFFRCRGMTEEETYTRTLRWNSAFCAPPICPKELEKTTKSIYHGKAEYGCGTLEKISQCIPQKCKIARRAFPVVSGSTAGTFPRSQGTRKT